MTYLLQNVKEVFLLLFISFLVGSSHRVDLAMKFEASTLKSIFPRAVGGQRFVKSIPFLPRRGNHGQSFTTLQQQQSSLTNSDPFCSPLTNSSTGMDTCSTLNYKPDVPTTFSLATGTASSKVGGFECCTETALKPDRTTGLVLPDLIQKLYTVVIFLLKRSVGIMLGLKQHPLSPGNMVPAACKTAKAVGVAARTMRWAGPKVIKISERLQNVIRRKREAQPHNERIVSVQV